MATLAEKMKKAEDDIDALAAAVLAIKENALPGTDLLTLTYTNPKTKAFTPLTRGLAGRTC